MTQYRAIEKRDGCMGLRLYRADKASALTVSMMECALPYTSQERKAG
jgi:hypothetical protein